MPHDLSLHSGERQTATRYEENRADHRYRYEWAARLIPAGAFGLDVFCGNGYGTWLLAQSRHVLGLDGSEEAVNFAARHYGGPRARFAHAYWPFELPKSAFDFIISLESVEHVRDGDQFFRELCEALKPGGMLVYSTPNEDLLPHASTGNHFHFRHFTLDQTLHLAAQNNLRVMDWAGQNVYQLLPDGRQGPLLDEAEMRLSQKAAGQFCIVACQKPDSARQGSPQRISEVRKPLPDARPIVVAGDIFRLADGDGTGKLVWHQRGNVLWIERLVWAALSGSPAIHVSILDHAALGLSLSDFAPAEGESSEDWWVRKISGPLDDKLAEKIQSAVRGKVVVAFEIPDNLRAVVAEAAHALIEMEIAPVRFLDDLLLTVSSTSNELNARAVRAQISEQEISSRLGTIIGRMGSLEAEQDIDTNNVALIAGQVSFDRSLIHDGRFLNLGDFADEIAALADQHDVVLIRPHPNASTEIRGFDALLHIPGLRITTANSYRMLAAGRIRTLAAISSSLLIEAQYFGIETVRFAYSPQRALPMVRAQSFGGDIADEIASICGTVLPDLQGRPLPQGPILRQISGLDWALRDVTASQSLLPAVSCDPPKRLIPREPDLAAGLAYGWYPAEEWGAWSGPFGVINIDWPGARAEPLSCAAEIFSLAIDPQRITIWADGNRLASAALVGGEVTRVSFELLMPTRPGPIQLLLVPDPAVRPADLLGNGDFRLLGVGLIALEFL